MRLWLVEIAVKSLLHLNKFFEEEIEGEQT